jgi:hypothetical protein
MISLHKLRFLTYTGGHAKISHLVASSQVYKRQQVAFARLVPSCRQIWNNMLITCNNLDDIIGHVVRLIQQVRYSRDITIFLQPYVVNLETLLLYDDSDNLKSLIK